MRALELKLRVSIQDRVWRVRLRDRWLYVLVLLEFQSAVDRTMAVRILAYTALLYQDLLRASSDPLPPVLPIVLYDGSERWTAAKDVAGLLAPYGEPLAPYQPSQRYFLLDVRGYTDSLPEGRNRVAELIRLARSRGLKEMVTMFAGLAESLSEPEHEGLIRAFWEWLDKVHLPAQGLDVELPALKNWREAGTMMNEAVNDWTAPWREEGRAEGRAQGQTEVMRRMAARKFDAGTAQRLAERLAEIADPERVAEIGEWLIECEHGDELLARVEGLCRTPATGDDPSRR